MGTVEIVGVAPVLVEDPGLKDGVEDLPGGELIPGFAVEAFHVGVLPGGAWVNEAGAVAGAGDRSPFMSPVRVIGDPDNTRSPVSEASELDAGAA